MHSLSYIMTSHILKLVFIASLMPNNLLLSTTYAGAYNGASINSVEIKSYPGYFDCSFGSISYTSKLVVENYTADSLKYASYSYEFDYGDGFTDVVQNVTQVALDKNITNSPHTYSQDGVYQVNCRRNFKVVDISGSSAETSSLIRDTALFEITGTSCRKLPTDSEDEKPRRMLFSNWLIITLSITSVLEIIIGCIIWYRCKGSPRHVADSDQQSIGDSSDTVIEKWSEEVL
jgi:hypothetical protein